MKVILDNGHGGLIGGVYQTKGKRSPDWQYGILYEGVFNRWIVNALKKELDYKGISYYHISPEDKDISLQERVHRANDIYLKDPDTFLLSIHANAGGGRGAEVYTYYGESRSDRIATGLIRHIEDNLGATPVRKDYADGDPDKEAGFYILKYTMMPAVLYEVAFMDNKRDYELLWNPDFHEDVVDMLVSFIKNMLKW